MTHPIGFDNGGYRRFGWVRSIAKFHVGTDIRCPLGTPVMAMAPGTVLRQTGQHSGYGSLNPSKSGGVIFIQHSKTISQYGHVQIDRKIRPGEQVEEGQVIGSIAAFYDGTDMLPHLHFGIWKGLTLPSNGWGYVASSSKMAHWIDPLTWKYNNWH